MTALARFSAAAKGRSNIQDHGVLPDTSSPGISVTKLFQYQSFFDGFQLQNAILTQSANEPIVGSTMEEVKIGGYGLALHPSSQTPVAILPMVGGSAAQAAPIILRPGQVYRPHGRIGEAQGNFSTFRWGIPFGWLGGGLATIYVLPSSDASVDWSGDAPEIIFQRQQMLVADPATFGAAGPSAAPLNWPLRFPWPNAARGLTPIPQPGQAIIGIGKPTRVLTSLRVASLAAPATMRIIFQGTNDMDLDSSGNVVLTTPRFIEVVWGSFAANGGIGNLGTNYPVMELTGEIVRLACDDGGIQLADMSGGSLLGAQIDVVRYGIL